MSLLAPLPNVRDVALTDNPAIESALNRALGLWGAYPGEFRELMANAMRTDYSWAPPGQDYLNIYEYIRHK